MAQAQAFLASPTSPGQASAAAGPAKKGQKNASIDGQRQVVDGNHALAELLADAMHPDWGSAMVTRCLCGCGDCVIRQIAASRAGMADLH